MPTGKKPGSNHRPRNRILNALPKAQLDRIQEDLELITMEPREVMIDANTPIKNVYFVESGVVSVIGVLSDGTAVETATIGNEGMVGLQIFHGVDRTAAQCFCQIPGQVFRLSTPKFRGLIDSDNGALRQILGRYTEALFTMVGQSSACNRVHLVQQRCARWLLQSHDRMDSDEFPLTHQFLAQMLGVRRATVTEAASALQDAGAIEYSMGIIRILDRGVLEKSSCECYAIITSEFSRLLGGNRVGSPLDGVRTSKNGLSTMKEPESSSD